MIFFLFVIAFVTCACVLVPLVTFGVCAVADWRRTRRSTRPANPAAPGVEAPGA
jgi:hypothetical protein